jgi:hypothetical protein
MNSYALRGAALPSLPREAPGTRSPAGARSFYDSRTTVITSSAYCRATAGASVAGTRGLSIGWQFRERVPTYCLPELGTQLVGELLPRPWNLDGSNGIIRPVAGRFRLE